MRLPPLRPEVAEATPAGLGGDGAGLEATPAGLGGDGAGLGGNGVGLGGNGVGSDGAAAGSVDNGVGLGGNGVGSGGDGAGLGGNGVGSGGAAAGLEELADELVAIGRQAGLAAVGIAGAHVFGDTLRDLHDRKRDGLNGDMQFTYRNPERSTDPVRTLRGARSLVVGAWGYRHAEEPAPPDPRSLRRPVARVARYARADHYACLRHALSLVAARLQLEGWKALVVCDDNALVDRAAAHRAGLGWFGKNSLLLLPGLGSWFVLGSVITDAPLGIRNGNPGLVGKTDRVPMAAGAVPVSCSPPKAGAVPVSCSPPQPAAHGSGCGSCSRCMTACPTGALVSPGVLDARRCLAWLVQAAGSFPVEYRDALGGRIYGCDDCQVVCPVNRMADRRHPPVATGSQASGEAGTFVENTTRVDTGAGVDLIELLDSSDAQLLERHGRWYIARRDPRYVRRNALVALGNIGDGTDSDTERVLRAALGGSDLMIVEHARWAALKLGRDDLVELTS